MMEILFSMAENEQSGLVFDGTVNGKVIGHAQMYPYEETVLGLDALWLTDGGKETVDYSEFAEAFFSHLKGLGYTKLFLVTEDMEFGEHLSFQLEERDNSGWYPKYIYCRIL